MPIVVKFESKRRRRGRRRGLDAAVLVQRQAEAVLAHLSTSLIDGVSPVDGSPRPRKPDGKPLGFRTGRLALKMRVGRVKKSRARARVMIILPRGALADDFREVFVAGHPDILTTQGQAGVVLDLATREYLEELQET